MMKRLSALALASACAMPLVAIAQDDAEPTERRFYIAPGGNFFVADRDRLSGDGSGFTFAIGKRFGSHFALELKYNEINLGQDKFAGADTGITFDGDMFSLDLFLYGANYKAWNPYLVFGIGQADVDATSDGTLIPAGTFNNDYVTAEIGFGFQNEMTEAGSAIRTDVRYHHQDGDGDPSASFNDFVFNMNLLIPLGARKAEADARPSTPEPYDQRLYFVAGPNYLRPDRDRISEDDYGARIGVGFQYRSKTAIEFRYENTEVDGLAGIPLTTELENLGVDILFHRSKNNTLRPFFLFGLGFQETTLKVPGASADYDSLALDFGFGVQSVRNSAPIGWRVDVRNRHVFVESKDRQFTGGEKSLDDLLFNMAAIVPIGKNPWKKEEVIEEPVVEVAEVVQTDSDGDSVFDTQDQCPNTPAGAEVDANGCERDNDSDGVPNSKDQCPNSEPGAKVDETGCVPLPDILVLEGVNFETASAQLTANATTILDNVAERVAARADINLEVGGHTDWVGATAYNQALSARRARSVQDYLISKGIDASRLTARGYGESSPVADNNTASGRERNRRVELKIVR